MPGDPPNARCRSTPADLVFTPQQVCSTDRWPLYLCCCPPRPLAPAAGILFTLLQLPQAVAAISGAQADVEAALRYVLTLECDAEGRPGKRRDLAGGLALAGERWRGGRGLLLAEQR